MNVLNQNATEARGKIFVSIIMKEGEIKRGILLSRMHVSNQTFSREFMDFLDVYPTIKYSRDTRLFTYEP